MKNLNSKVVLLLLGVVSGVSAIILAISGNPKNMAICTACFIRDTVGSIGLHNAEVVQYYRPEILGFVLGAFILSIVLKEYKAREANGVFVRFTLGTIMMIGALIFLGCPLRMIIRMSAGDLNSYVGLIGFVLGTLVGSLFIKKGFSIGEEKEGESRVSKFSTVLFIIFLVGGLLLSMGTTILSASEKGPGSFRAPIIISLVCAIVFGGVAYLTRMCFGGAFRNIFLMKNFQVIMPIIGVFVSLTVYNIINGSFKFSFASQPISHQEHLFNIIGLFIVGFAAVLASGCPLRQLINTGSGSGNALVTVLGLFFGAAISHNFKLASVADSVSDAGEVVLGGATSNGKIAAIICIVLLIVIGVMGIKKDKRK